MTFSDSHFAHILQTLFGLTAWLPVVFRISLTLVQCNFATSHCIALCYLTHLDLGEEEDEVFSFLHNPIFSICHKHIK